MLELDQIIGHQAVLRGERYTGGEKNNMGGGEKNQLNMNKGGEVINFKVFKKRVDVVLRDVV